MTHFNPLCFLNIAVFLRGQVFLLPVLYVFYQQNGLSLSDFFFFQGIVTCVSLLFYIPAGYLADLFSKKRILILSMLFALTRSLLWLYFSGYWIVLIGEISYALSKSFFSGIVDSYMCDYLKTQNQQYKMTKKYGKLNFFMSLSSAISALIGPLFLIHFPLKFLVFLDALFILFSIACLFRLPEVPIFNKNKQSLFSHYLQIFFVLRRIIHQDLWRVILYSGLFTATTILLVWCFQPLMLCSLIPIVWFGVISFCNHLSRSVFSLYIQKITNYLPLQKLKKWTCTFFITSIIGLSWAFYLKNIYISVIMLLIVCFVTGLQLAYTVTSVSYVHAEIKSENRSLISSINFMIAALLSSVILLAIKQSLYFTTIDYALLGYAVFFAISVFAIHKIPKGTLKNHS